MMLLSCVCEGCGTCGGSSQFVGGLTNGGGLSKKFGKSCNMVMLLSVSLERDDVKGCKEMWER